MYYVLNVGACAGALISAVPMAAVGDTVARWTFPAALGLSAVLLVAALGLLLSEAAAAEAPELPGEKRRRRHESLEKDLASDAASDLPAPLPGVPEAKTDEETKEEAKTAPSDASEERRVEEVRRQSLGERLGALEERWAADALGGAWGPGAAHVRQLSGSYARDGAAFSQGEASEVRKTVCVLLAAARRRPWCATAVLCGVMSLSGFLMNALAWVALARAGGAATSCAAGGWEYDPGGRRERPGDQPWAAIAFGLALASGGLLLLSALLLQRCDRDAGYLEACKVEHGGDHAAADVDHAKDVLLLSPFVGLGMLYNSVYYYCEGAYVLQAAVSHEAALAAGDDDDRARARASLYDSAAVTVGGNYDSFLVLALLPVVVGIVWPGVERHLGYPLRPLEKILASGCALGGSLACSAIVDVFHIPALPWTSQLPQYFLLAIAEIHWTIPAYEVFFSEMPPDLRMMSMALYMYTLAVGHTLGVTSKLFVCARTLGATTFSVLGCLLLVACWWGFSSPYIYRQEREWTVAHHRGSTLRAPLLSPSGGPSRPSSRSRTSERRGEIVATLRGMFDGLDAQYLIPFSLLKMGKLVASGGSGQVYRGRYAGARVAIKSLYSQMMDPEYVAEVRHEARMLAAVRHPHITNFHGISRFENRLLLVTEFVPVSLDGLVRLARAKYDKQQQQRALLAHHRGCDRRPKPSGRAHSSASNPKRPALAASSPPALSADDAPAASTSSRGSSAAAPDPPEPEPESTAAWPGRFGGSRSAPTSPAPSRAATPPPKRFSGAPFRPDRFSVEDARRIWVELAQTLIYLHSSGLAHRDVKPSNMLLEEGHDGRYHLKLCDLGMARFSPLSGPRANKFVTLGAGTPAYSPPESYRPAPGPRPGPARTPRGWSPADEPASPAAEIDDLSKWDIFSFATVIWYSWYCADPFHGLSVPEVCVAVARGDRPLFEDGDDAPPSLLALVDAMWHQQPSARPSAIAVLAALQSEDLTKEFLHIAFKQDRDNSSLLPHAPKPPSSSNV